MSMPNSNLQAILGQLLAATQGSTAAQTTSTGPTDVTAIIAALAMLSPQLASTLRSQLPSNVTADASNADLLSDTYRRANLTFTARERPSGSPGRGEFKLKQVLQLNKHDYDLFLRTVKDAVYAARLDRTQMMKSQDPERLSSARAKIKKALPGLVVYANCRFPYWPVDAGLLVILKAFTEAHRRRLELLAQGEAAGTNIVDDDSMPDGSNNANAIASANNAPANYDDAPAGTEDADADTNYDNNGHDNSNDSAHNSDDDDVDAHTTMASIHELDELDHEETAHSDQDLPEDEEMDDTLDPPAYNSTSSSINPVLGPNNAPVAVNKSQPRKSSPTAAAAASPAEKRALSTTPTTAKPATPADLTSTRPNRSRRENKAESVSSHVSIAPSSNVISTSAVTAPATTTISYASTTSTTVQAQASTTTGLPLEQANTAHSAWLPASKRQSIPSASAPDPADSLAPATKGKRATRATPRGNSNEPASPADPVDPQPATKPKRKARAPIVKEAEPVPDPEVLELSDAEAAPPPTKPTRKRTTAAKQPAKNKAASKTQSK
ncbi:hypothetical protein RhiLY_10376 [Ceratobasidium sp. AG-Ba]|nr:hypothetical protein RhiLY_10376 [Ceratobasidium sp. AG-Ba]